MLDVILFFLYMVLLSYMFWILIERNILKKVRGDNHDW